VIDTVAKLKPKLVNASFTEDRFGNKDHAIHLFGNANSYLNLGTSNLLKPKEGSISMWVYVENELWYGTGYKTNPLIVAKRSREDDFFEAYAIYYMFETKKVAALCTKDSTNQVIFSCRNRFEIQKWNHLVFSYNRDTAYFYINGELDNKFKTGFELEFLNDDSVLVGVTANMKNNRFFSGSVDDIAFYNKVLNLKEVKAIYLTPDPNRLNRLYYWLKIAVLIIVFGLVLHGFIRNQLNLKMKRYREKLIFQTRLLETELRVNRALMNPHFIFNSLNAIQDFILKGHNEEAGDYLIKFSKLVRKILQSNGSEFISLSTEMEILSGYLEIEELRFGKEFNYLIICDSAINKDQILIPIMMIQPFVENAIWHGLKKKDGDKILRVSFKRLGNSHLLCLVDDNGIGIKNAQKLENEEKRSMAIIFVKSRLELYNTLYNQGSSLEIIEKENDSGTIAKIILPYKFDHNAKSHTS